jgi:DNA sulfur modification protein DndD
MIINRVTLENIRLFKGIHTLNLTPIQNQGKTKPIILIGGKNGSGKTTIFESILLCLYGQKYLGNKITKQKFESYIEKMISSNNHSEDHKQAAIEVEFEFTHFTSSYNYLVRREWKFEDRFSEKLVVKKNGEILSDLEKDQWQDLLNELIPQRFSRLFLFDGEKIQSLIDDETDNLYLKDSFKSLLGLDLVERLKTDLDLYISRYIKSQSSDQENREILELGIKIDDIEKKLLDCQQERAQLQSRYDQIIGEIERQESRVAREGGTFAKKRDHLKDEKVRLDNEIIRVEEELRDLSSGLLPFAITPKYCALLKKHLIEEEKTQALQRSKDLIDKQLEKITSSIQSKQFWKDVSLSASQRNNVITKISNLLTNDIEISSLKSDSPLVHHLSQYDHHLLLQWIGEANEKVPERLTDTTGKLEVLIRKRERTVGSINKAPEDDIIAPLIQKLNEFNQFLGQVQEKLKIKDEEIRDYEFKINEFKRQLKKEQEGIVTFQKLSRRIQFAQKANRILDEYIHQLQLMKISQLSENILTCFSHLLRKEDYIKDIQISNDYSITLFDYEGYAIPKEQLSAGEKEIFAISLLWGLTLTSGRQLPFIIDTPLGRLDSDHRGNLVMDFFQHAGDQMIIFSTDTEIDREYFRILHPHISRAYHLDYSQKEKETEITPGYFWQSELQGSPT